MTLARLLVAAAIAFSASAHGQGLRLPERGGAAGLDPTFARGWLAPDFDRFGFATPHAAWKDAIGFAPSQRMNWSYAVGDRGTLSMSFGSSREPDLDRPMSLYGRYWISPDWAVSAESLSRDAGGLIRFNDFRIGIQRRF
jgi:hypothetical protein